MDNAQLKNRDEELKNLLVFVSICLHLLSYPQFIIMTGRPIGLSSYGFRITVL
jgi:hypothetical protein